MATIVKEKKKSGLLVETIPYEPGHGHQNGNGHNGNGHIVRKARRSVADILTKAADALVKHGWIQGEEFLPGEGFCWLGAINYAVTGVEGGQPSSDEQFQLMTQAGVQCARLLDPGLPSAPDDWSAVVDWNDDGNRTKCQVLSLLRRAAKAAGVK